MGEYWENLTTWKKVKLALAVVAVIFVVIFAVVNWQEAMVNFVFFRLKTSVTLLIVICFCIGYLVSSIFDFKPSKEREAEIQRLRAEIETLKKASEEDHAGDVPAPEIIE